MAVIAVGVELQEIGALASAAAGGGAADGLAHGQHIHAIDNLGMHVVFGKAGSAARHGLDARHLIFGAAGHTVMVVEDDINDG